ncbi:PRA1 protein B1 [Ranunculus cassubicifolius]
MASPPTLPISNPQSTQSQPSTTLAFSTPAFRAFINRLSDSLRVAFSRRRPWYELIDRSAFTRPDSVSDALSRVRKNYTYFRINYLTLLGSVLALSLITHPISLFFLLVLLSSWLFLYFFRPSDSPLVMFNRQFSDFETLAFLVVFTVIVIFLTSVGSVLISALMIGLTIVAVHGSFRVPEDLFLDEQEPVGGAGFLSFLGGAASSVSAAAAAPSMASRV